MSICCVRCKSVSKLPIFCNSCYQESFKSGERRGHVEVIDIIKKQRKVYWSNLKIAKPKDSAWQEGAYSACNYLIQLIKEKELGMLEKGELL